MANIDQLPDYRANLPRTGHNLSHQFGFTCTVSHLLPVFHDFLNPGETVTLGFDYMLRTQPLESASMGRLKTHTEYFFVPMQLLYQGFSDWYYGIQEEFSSRFLENGFMAQFALPLLDINAAMISLHGFRNDTTISISGPAVHSHESVATNAYRFFDMLGFNPSPVLKGTATGAVNGSVFPYQILAYNCIYQNYYRLDTREIFNPGSFNVDRYYNQNIADPFFKYCLLKYRPFDNDYFNDIKVSPIVDVLNLNNKDSLDAATSYLTRSANGSNSVLSSASRGSVNDSPSVGQRSNPSDYIQTQFGFKQINNTQEGVTDNSQGRWTPRDEGPFDEIFTPNGTLAGIADNDVNLLHTHTFHSQDTLNGLDITTANIRALFASEKLWSVTGRAKKKYDDQTLAHFGYKVPHDPKHQITCFGHDIGDISIGEVISTANTGDSGSPLGEIAGKGYGAQGNKRHKFTAPCHGVIMVIFSVVPEEYYQDTFLKANKLSDRSDLYTPEYDHLGMQPLFRYEVDLSAALTGDEILGWQYRYEQWKRRYNRVTSVFKHESPVSLHGGSLSSWIHTINPFNGNGYMLANRPNSATYHYFSHKPNELNDIFLVEYQTAYSDDYAQNPEHVYDTDPFVVNSHIDCVKVSTMSDYSLPRLDV